MENEQRILIVEDDGSVSDFFEYGAHRRRLQGWGCYKVG